MFELYSVMHRLGYEKLNPMQEKAIAEGVLDAPRSLVCAPTASGKTLIAMLKLLKNYEETKGKALYVVPLKALAQEKYREFSELFAQFGIKVAVSTSDFDASPEELLSSDVIIITVEKLDSMLRHGKEWLKGVNFAAIDEAHLLNDDHRGSTLELVLVKLMDLQAHLMCLSATISNASEVAGWLNAKLFQSTYRPTKLVKAIAASNNKMYVMDGAQQKIRTLESKDRLREVLGECFSKSGQAIVFVSSRRSAESTANELGVLTKQFLREGEAATLSALSKKALKALPNPTMQCKLLSNCLENGVAFHHAGITGKQRAVIEDGFKKERVLKAIVATTTLAMGIDFPASVVVVRDLKRFTGAFSEFIPNFEVEQMLGRAGRPRYDKEGLGIMFCSEKDVDYVKENYEFGELEKINSKLSSAAMLRMHCLGLIASGYCNSFTSLYEFFSRSLFAFQYKSTEELFKLIEEVVQELKGMEFVAEKKTSLIPTPMGKRVSELYVDPLSADLFAEFIRSKGEKKDFDYLFALNCATEMRPFVSVARDEEHALFQELNSITLCPFLEEKFDDYNFVSKYKSSKLLNAWINEQTEDKILSDFQVPPGVLQARVRNSIWLAYAMQELAFLLNATSVYKHAKRIRRRLKHGIMEELLPLCKFKGIGRVRARRLFNRGVRSPEDLTNLSKEELKKIIGVSLAVQ